MRGGQPRRRQAWVAAACLAWLVAVLVAPVRAQDDAALRRVLQPFAQVKALSARFTEVKKIALLKQPIESEGELHYARPHQLVRRTTSPVASKLIVRKGRLTMVDATGPQHLDLDSQPEVAALADALMLVFEGDAGRLKAMMRYDLQVDDDGHFTLKLVPRDEKLAKLVREMQAEGKGAVLSSLRIVDGFGDATTTTFHEVKLRGPFSEAERKRLFSETP